MPGEAEVQGLLALMLHCEARWPARRGPAGRYVPLSEQDPKQWSLPLIEEAEHHLSEAFKQARSGRFQLEAAIQSVHAESARSGRTDWSAIALFYEQLVRISPALGSRVGYAAAVAEANGPLAGLKLLEEIEVEVVSGYQPYWAVRAHLLQKLARSAEASEAYERAIGLAEDPAVREFLLQKRGSLFLGDVEIAPPRCRGSLAVKLSFPGAKSVEYTFRGGTYVPCMHRKHSSHSRRSWIHGRNSAVYMAWFRKFFKGKTREK